ncbi:hypothetical protein Heal19_500067 (plasmid) [Lactiplantibacillus plantarum]|nr:hypothetical protein Heal19_500067 [Lactiplantibacillus plantarum]
MGADIWKKILTLKPLQMGSFWDKPFVDLTWPLLQNYR